MVNQFRFFMVFVMAHLIPMHFSGNQPFKTGYALTLITIINLYAWWLSDYPHLIKKLRNSIVNTERQLEWSEQKITSNHLLDVVERKQTKLRWKHIKLRGRYKSRTGSTRITSPGRINSDQPGSTRIIGKLKIIRK